MVILRILLYTLIRNRSCIIRLILNILLLQLFMPVREILQTKIKIANPLLNLF